MWVFVLNLAGVCNEMLKKRVKVAKFKKLSSIWCYVSSTSEGKYFLYTFQPIVYVDRQ